MSKRIKVELFFILRLFRDRLLCCVWPYCKNRFLGRYLLKKMAKFEYQPDENIELHSLCQRSDLWMLASSLKSFLYHSGLRPLIIVHDDGSIDNSSAKLVESKFSGLRVLKKKDADEMIDNFPGITEKVLNYRKNGHIMIMEFMDIFLLSRAKTVIVYDSDILFFKTPTEVTDFFKPDNRLEALISPQNGTYDLMMDDYYLNRHRPVEKRTGYINPGLIVYKKDAIKFDQFLEYFDHTLRNVQDYFVGMTAWGCLISQTNFKILSIDRYILKGRPDERTVMKHFTSPRRHELFAYGISKVEKSINEGI